MEREILFLEKKVAEAGSTLFSLLKDESLLSLVQMAKMQNQTNCLYVSKPSTALAVNTLEACVSIFSRYLKIMDEKIQNQEKQLSDLRVTNESLRQQLGLSAGRSILKKVGDQLTTDKKELERSFRRIEHEYAGCRSELAKQNKLRLDGEKKIRILEEEKLSLNNLLREKSGLPPQSYSTAGFSEPPKSMDPPKPSNAELDKDNPMLPKKKRGPEKVQVTEASAALLDELDSLELEYETKAPLSVGGTPTPAIHHSHSSSSPQQPHHVQFQTHSSHPYSPQPQQSNPQSSFSQGQQQGPSVAPTNPTEIYAGVSAQLDKLQTTSSGFQRRYLQSCPYHPPIFSTSQNHAGLIARKVKEVSEILNCPPPPSPQQALSLSIAVITIVDGVVSFYDHLPSNESLSAYLRVLNATVAALDPAYRCLEHAFRSNDISSSPLKSYLLEVLKVLKLIL